jgi:mRNA interferase RelE/StbE
VNVEFKRSFAKDLKRLRSKALRAQLLTVIEQVEQAATLDEVANLKRLTGDGLYFRIRLGDYRIGLLFVEQTVVFVRFLHRRDIYRFFP